LANVHGRILPASLTASTASSWSVIKRLNERTTEIRHRAPLSASRVPKLRDRGVTLSLRSHAERVKVVERSSELAPGDTQAEEQRAKLPEAYVALSALDRAHKRSVQARGVRESFLRVAGCFSERANRLGQGLEFAVTRRHCPRRSTPRINAAVYRSRR
jgi:hypothetical protein